ncbi:MAG: 7-cyano-7-deazaguanine synthase QueC [Bdellovibrionota bacterium]|nr:7-cyano-7-deazaguanine synthase QueC [Bdellovibrionota bacterium]
MTAIVLVSGGMDSAAVIGVAAKEHNDLAFLHITYGQNTAQKERECFEKLADHYQVPAEKRKVIDISFLRQIGGSSLTDENISVSDYAGDSDRIPSSYVPFRNTHIIACAVSWAEILGATNIYIGANEEDSPGYPDCRPAYYDAYNELIKKGTKEGRISIKTPVISLKKAEIIKLAQENDVPLQLTWSCYAKNDLACGVCDSCALRLRGFKELGKQDPIAYQK